MNILFGGNYKVFDGLLLCLLSMTKHTDEKIDVYILTADLTKMNPEYRPISEENRLLLEAVLKRKNKDSSVKIIMLGKDFEEWVENSQNKMNFYTPFAFLRLFATQVEGLPDKIIYLDTDIMLNGNIKELFDVDISNYELGVVKDRYGRFFINPKYFNSGMLLINLPMIKQTKLFERVLDMCLNKKMAFPDQSALNKCCKHKLYLPRKFNEQGDLKKDTIVQHFTQRFTLWPYFHKVNIKPWHVDKVHKVRKNFAYDDIYEEYFKIKNMGLKYFKNK